jgi:hypothetical protein
VGSTVALASMPLKPEKKPHHLLIIIGVGKPKPGQTVGFRGAKKKAKAQPKEK